MGRRSEQKAATRARILASAQALFRDKGFDNTTIAAVAKQAGVSAGSVIGHFPDKQALIAAAFHEVLNKQIELGFGTLPQKGALLQLAHLATVLYQWYAAHPTLGAALVQQSLFMGGDVGQQLVQQRQRFITKVAEIISFGVAEGELKAAPPELLAGGFFADYFAVLLSGLYGQYRSSNEFFRVESAINDLMALTALRMAK